jgi:hypothetical protein
MHFYITNLFCWWEWNDCTNLIGMAKGLNPFANGLFTKISSVSPLEKGPMIQSLKLGLEGFWYSRGASLVTCLVEGF